MGPKLLDSNDALWEPYVVRRVHKLHRLFFVHFKHAEINIDPTASNVVQLEPS